MRIVQVRWVFAVMFTAALINGVRSQQNGGTGERTIEPTPGPAAPADPTPAPTPGPTAPADPTPAPTPGPSDGTDTGSAAPGMAPQPTTPAPGMTPPPTTPSPHQGDDTDGNEASEDCSDGIEGTTDEGFVVCCASATCDTCSDEDGCDDDGCCPSAIVSSAVSCEYGGPPCIVSSGNESETSSADSNSDTPTGVIILGAILAALLLGNVVCCFMLKRRKKSPTPLEPVPARFNADAEIGRQQNAEILCLQEELTNERNRRMKADDIIRANRGGIRIGDFPSVRDVDLDLENLAGHAIKWAENASVIGGAHPALPSTVKSVLENTFLVCRQEVKRCFDERLESLSEFLGNDEPVVLSGGDSMNLDTQYVLYECLRRNFRTIVPTEPDHVKELAGMVQQRSEGVADEALAGEVIFGDGWGTFDNLVQKFIMVFVEMALQKPAMEFHDNLGESRTFDPVVHRDWAPYLKVPMEQCCVVFPAILHQEGRPKSNAKAGVVRLAA